MWENYLREQVSLHPSMEPQDVMKFCFQAAFGAEHLLRDKEAAWRYLQAEYESISVEEGIGEKGIAVREDSMVGEPLYECISDTLCRVNLRAWKRKGLPLEWLFKMFVKGAEEAAGTVESRQADLDTYVKKETGESVGVNVGNDADEKKGGISKFAVILQQAEALIGEGVFNFTLEAWNEYLSTYSISHPVAVHHSEAYRVAEKPAYRLVPWKYMRLMPILEVLCDTGLWNGVVRKEMAEVYVIAIDGRCASGKTTMAQMLVELTGAGIVHMDDFFLPMELRTSERLLEPGGNVHYERVLEEVIPHLRNAEAFSYGKFDCSRMTIAGSRLVEAGNLRIVEGAYSCHPKLGEYMSLRVFSDVHADTQLARIAARDGENALAAYRGRWIPMEENYLAAYEIKSRADIVL